MTDFAVDQIDHVELFVPDQYAAAEWFRDALGLEILEDYEHWADSGPLMLSSDGGNTKLALFRGEPIDALPQAAFRRLAFRVDAPGFDMFLTRAADLDLRGEDDSRLEALTVVDHGESFSVYFRDPWGHRFEVTTYETTAVKNRP